MQPLKLLRNFSDEENLKPIFNLKNFIKPDELNIKFYFWEVFVLRVHYCLRIANEDILLLG